MAELTTLGENPLWNAACAFSKRMYALGQSERFSQHFMRDRIQTTSMSLMTLLTQAHVETEAAQARLLYLSARGNLRELSYFLTIARDLGIADSSDQDHVEASYNRLLDRLEQRIETLNRMARIA